MHLQTVKEHVLYFITGLSIIQRTYLIIFILFMYHLCVCLIHFIVNEVFLTVYQQLD